MVARCLHIEGVEFFPINIGRFVITSGRNNAYMRAIYTTDDYRENPQREKNIHNAASFSDLQGKLEHSVFQCEQTVSHVRHHPGNSSNVCLRRRDNNNLEKCPRSQKTQCQRDLMTYGQSLFPSWRSPKRRLQQSYESVNIVGRKTCTSGAPHRPSSPSPVD
ncbi:hypothetical protein DPMN_047150 [Dreissena polymorpha]|uniref:Uncharacterized protein n=1 Tax=Dreissena polymorpha TaxID=45954 RepID=A0A9D4D963_DREPO|nr:hypothetical protein DPMN_047150 [Dreissena polymorpha]